MFLVTQLQQGIKNDFEIDCFCCFCSKSSSLFFKKKERNSRDVFTCFTCFTNLDSNCCVALASIAKKL